MTTNHNRGVGVRMSKKTQDTTEKLADENASMSTIEICWRVGMILCGIATSLTSYKVAISGNITAFVICFIATLVLLNVAFSSKR